VTTTTHVTTASTPQTASTTTLAPEFPAQNEPIDLGPLQPRGGHSVIWTGTEMIVWGGAGGAEGSRPFADGAALDPTTNTWRVIASAPISARSYHVAAWTGEEMLIVGGAGAVGGAAYDPESDKWRRIADPPLLIGPDPGTPIEGVVGSIWAGNRLIVWQVQANGAAVYDPVNDEWQDLAPPFSTDRGVLRRDGGAVYAFAADIDDYPMYVPLRLARLDGGAWEELPEVGLWTDQLLVAARPELTGWTGESFLAWSDSGAEGRTVTFDTTAGNWHDAAPTVVPPCEWAMEPVELDARILVYGGCGGHAIYNAAANTWTTVPILGIGQGRYSVWTGSEVLNWGDTCCYGSPGVAPDGTTWRFVPPE
jgi:hypothetical protein